MTRWNRLHLSTMLLFLAAGLLVAAPQQKPTPAPERALISQYCVTCHNTKLNTAGLALDTLTADPVNQHPATWEKVVRKLRARYMPPLGLPRPDDATYNAAVSS